MSNRGKSFEDRFKKDWESSIPDSFLLRLPDQQSGYFGTSANPCDFICYYDSNMFMFETKSHKGNTFPFSAFSQYPKLKEIFRKKIKGLIVGVVLWMVDHDKIIYIPIESFIEMEKDNRKSFNIKYLESQEYKCFEIPSIKLRTFLRSDYSFLLKLVDDEVV